MHFDLFILEASQRLPGCPRGSIARKLREGWREFCRKTGTLTESITVDLREDVAVYPLVSSFDADILSIMDVWTRNVEDVASGRYGLRLASRFYRLELDAAGRSSIRLAPTPGEDINGGLVVRVTLLPQRDRGFTEQTIADAYFEGIVGYCVARHAAQERRPWSNPAIAQMAQADYATALSRAMNLVARDGRDELQCLET